MQPPEAFGSKNDPLYDDLCSSLESAQPIDSFLSIPLPQSLGLTAPSPQVPQPGHRLKSRYLIESCLAEGGSAAVFIASDELLANRLVVVKVLNQIDDPDIVKDLISAEIHSLARLRHPNLRGILDLGQTDSGLPFLVLEYIEGESLRQLLARRQPIQTERIHKLLDGLVEALTEAHRFGIIHLDLKPENIILTDPGLPTERAVVIDFGIAAINAHASAAESFKQSPYSDPQLTTPPAPSADIFALALILKELYSCGLNPPQLSPKIQTAIARATSSDPSHRFTSVADFGAACTQSKASPLARVVFASALAVTFLIAILLNSQPPLAAWKSLNPKPFITEKGSHRDVRFSSDGQTLYFTSGLEGDFKIFSTPVSRFAPKPAAFHRSSEFSPLPSPDNRWLVFSRASADAYDIFLKPLNADGPERLLARLGSTTDATWLNDSSGLILTAKEFDSRPWALYLLRLDSPRLKRLFPLLPDNSEDQSPAIDPYTNRLAFVRRVQAKGHYLYTVPIGPEGLPIAEPRLLMVKASKLAQLAWVDNGKKILTHHDPYNTSTINAVAYPSGSVVPLDVPLAGISGFATNPKTQSLAITVSSSEQNIYRIQLSPAPVRLLNPVAASSFDEDEPSYSPNGKFIAFTSVRSGKPQIWIADRDGSNPRQITDFEESYDALTAVISPDSKSVYLSIRKAQGQITTYVTELNNTSKPKLFCSNGFLCSFSRDGSAFYFFRKVDSQYQIFRAPVNAPQSETQITTDGGSHAHESFNSNRLYISSRNENEGLHHLPLPFTPTAAIRKTLAPTLLRRSLFIPTQDGVYLIRKDDLNLPPGLFLIPENNQIPKLLYRFDRTVMWGLNLSPSQTELLVTLQDVTDQSVYLTKMPD
jgi:serine/threonine protein kinase